MNASVTRLSEDDPINQILYRECTDDFCTGYVTIGDEKTILPEYYSTYADALNKFEIHEDDVFVNSYPKAGTTWVQEMVWLIQNRLNFKGAEVNQKKRYPFLEGCVMFDYVKHGKFANVVHPEWTRNSLEFIKAQERPRFIKTHLPFSLLPQDIQDQKKSPKIVYVTRNPKDLCVSYYHHWKLLQPCTYRINFEDHIKLFLHGKLSWGCYWKHVLGYWEKRDMPNLLIVKYEDMKKDLQSVIRKVAAFLDKTLSDEEVSMLAKHLSFDSMKVNPAVNFQDAIGFLGGKGSFMRAGVIGQYKEELSPENLQKFDVWIKENVVGTSYESEYDFSV